MELACILNAFGVKVTILEYCKEILPNFDRDIAKRLHSLLSRRGIDIITSAQVTSIASGKKVGYLAKGKELSIEADEVVMAVGRRPVVPEGAEAAGIKLNRGAVVVDEALLSSVPGVYAIGDVNAHMMLAHVASAQAIAAMGGTINLDVVPSAVFTSPECSMVGLTEEQCKDKGFEYVAAKSLFRANGKAMAMGEPDGLVKLIVDKTSRKILGCSICGAHAADLIQEVATVMSAGLTVDAITQTIHAHPTLGEVVHTAAASL
jgi:dihydrolipoamide dehydrogenase